MAVNNQDRPSTSTSHIGSQMETNEDTSVSNYDQPWTKNETYQTGNAKFFIHGQDYELKWFMLFAWKDKKYEVDFRLASEMSDADKFDDLVFRYMENGKIMYRFLQAKHSKFSDDKIQVKDLKFSFDRNDYSLQKYFKSYLKIVYNKIFQDGDIQDLIICTNLNFYFEPSKRNGAEPGQKATKSSEENETWKGYFTEKKIRDPILNIGGKLYEFNKDSSKRRQVITVLKPIFKKALTYKSTNSKVTFLGELSKIAGVKDKKKLSDDCMEKIDEFLDKLVFAVGQPSGERLERIIRDKIGGEFNLITEITYNAFFKSMYDWKQHCISEKINAEENSVDVPRKRQKTIHKAFYLSHEDLEEIFQKGKSMLAGLGMVTLNLLCQSKIQDYGIRFKDENTEIQGVKKFLESKKEQILIMYHRNSALLSVSKIYQILEANKFKLDQYIFSDLKYLSYLKGSVKDPRGAFKDSTRNLLIVECNSKRKQNMLKSFFEILQQNSNKQMILIISEEDKESSEEELEDWLYELSIDKETKYTELIDCGNNLTDLTGKSQEVLLNEGIVIFQGRKVGLRTLIKDKQLISGEVLVKMINKEDIVIGREFIDSKYNEVKEYFIERTLTRCINVEEDILKENKKFMIINTSDESVSYPEYNQDILLVSHGEDFLKLCDKYRNHNIHHLRKEGNNLLWQQSHGNLQKLREFINKYVKDTTCKLKFIQDKLVIISGEPGGGKSMLLSHVAHHKKGSDRSIWVVRINLADYASAVSQMKKVNLETVVMFLYKVAFKHFLKKDNETDEENNSRLENIIKSFIVKDTEISVGPSVGKLDDLSLFEVMLFNEFYKHGKLMLLFDGFDEISPDYEVKVKELLKVLNGTRVKIWITTRRYNIYEGLENELGVFSYSIEPFIEKDQETYLKRFWKTPVDDERSKIFVDELLIRFAKSTTDVERNFVSIPLQLNMLAVIFKDIFKEWYGSEEPELSEKYKQKLNQQLTLNSLYKKFVYHKYYKIRFKEKNPNINADVPDIKKLMRNEYKQCLEDHRKLAAYAILGENQVGVFLSDEELKKIHGKIAKIKRASEKTGIITHIVNNRPVFVHRTFAEYFLVDFINKRLVSISETHEKIWDFLLGQILIRDEYYVTRRFFDCILTDGSLYSSVNRDPNKSRFIKELLKGMVEHTSLLPELYKSTPLHAASREGLTEIVKFILEYQPEDFLQIENDNMFLDNIRIYLSSTKELFVPLQRNYLNIRMNKFVNFGDIKGKTALFYAAESGNVGLTQYFLDNDASIILETQELTFKLFGIHPEVFQSLYEHMKNNGLKDLYFNTELGCFDKTLLHSLVQQKNSDNIPFLVKEGVNFNTTDNVGRTPLHLAAENELVDIACILIENGADVNFTNEEGMTPLHIASKYYKTEMTHFLIENGANINFRNKEEMTPLHFAVRFSNKDIVSILIGNGANVNATNKEGIAPLHIAVNYHDEETAKTLIENGADINVANKEGMTPLHFAAKCHDGDIARILIENGANVDVINKKGMTPSHFAAKYLDGKEVFKLSETLFSNINFGVNEELTNLNSPSKYDNEEFVCTLIENGADVNFTSKGGMTPLHLAARNQNQKVVSTLLKNGANVNVTNIEGMTPLLLATEANKKEIVSTLIENGANVNVTNNYGMSPLFFVAAYGNEEIVRILIEHGAYVNATNEEGMTPLLIAANYGNEEIVQTLIEHRADVNVTNKEGMTLLHFAARHGIGDLSIILIENGANVNVTNKEEMTPLHFATEHNHIDVIRTLIENGANVNVKNLEGMTPLLFATKCGDEEIVGNLIKNGADVNVTTKEGISALHFSIKYNNREIVRALIENGADILTSPILVRDKKEQITTLHYAAEYNRAQDVRTLVENGAKFNVTNKEGMAQLHFAAMCNSKEVVRTLIDKDVNNVNVTDKQGMTPLHFAARFDCVDVVHTLIEYGADVNVTDSADLTPLQYAVEDNHAKVVRTLIEKGTKVNVCNESKMSPLHIAAFYGYEEVANTLMKNGANIDVTNKDGMTPLHFAAQNNCTKVACTLIENGADVNVANEDGMTPLLFATKTGDEKIVRFLLEKGANIIVSDKDGMTPLLFTAKYGNEEILRTLMENGACVNFANNEGMTPLHFAAMCQDERVVRTLIEKRANVTIANKEGMTPLHFAAMCQEEKVIRTLIQNGADINVTNAEGFTPLHFATKYQNEDVVRIFIEYGADVNLTNKERMTQLHFAARYQDERVVCKLLQNGDDANVTNKNNMTPLHFAAMFNRVDVARTLIQMGANVNITNKEGMTPLHIAASNQNKNDLTTTLRSIQSAIKYHNGVVLRILIENGADVNVSDENGRVPLHFAAIYHNEEVVHILLEKGVNVNVTNEKGVTPLHFATRYDNSVHFVHTLIENGANVNVFDKEERTPLHYAAYFDSAEVVRTLLENGANVNVTNKEERTLLHWAVEYNHAKVVRTLIENGANVNVADKDGITPLHLAARSDRVRTLIEKGAITEAIIKVEMTLMIYASEINRVEIFRTLLEIGEEWIRKKK